MLLLALDKAFYFCASPTASVAYKEHMLEPSHVRNTNSILSLQYRSLRSLCPFKKGP